MVVVVMVLSGWLEVKVKWRDVIGVDVARYSAGLANRLDRRW